MRSPDDVPSPRQIDPRGHRFGGGLSAAILVLAFVLGAPIGAATAAWLLTGAVAALQTVLAVTGYCLGCRLYFLRWYGPALFDRLAAATAR